MGNGFGLGLRLGIGEGALHGEVLCLSVGKNLGSDQATVIAQHDDVAGNETTLRV